MANTKTLRLSVGALFTKGPGKIYFYRYQVAGRRKTVSLHTNNRAEALKKAQELIPIPLVYHKKTRSALKCTPKVRAGRFFMNEACQCFASCLEALDTPEACSEFLCNIRT